MKKAAQFFALIFLLSGCGFTYNVLFGIDTTPKWNLDQDIAKQAEKYNIPEEFNLVLDTASYIHALHDVYKNTFDSLKSSNADSAVTAKCKKAFNDDQQPVQFRLFDKSGTEIFKMVNCYIDPPIPLNWNVDDCFDVFPPQTENQTLNMHNFELAFLLNHVENVKQQKFTLATLPAADYYGVIMWNEMWKRPSRKLIKTVRENLEKTDKRVVLLYVNNQNQFIWWRLDFETKQKLHNELKAESAQF